MAKLNKYNLGFCLMATTVVCLGGIYAISNTSNLLTPALGSGKSFTLEINKSQKLTTSEEDASGSGFILTSNGSEIGVDYGRLKNSTQNWQKCDNSSGGYLQNTDPINGMTKITVNFSGNGTAYLYGGVRINSSWETYAEMGRNYLAKATSSPLTYEFEYPFDYFFLYFKKSNSTSYVEIENVKIDYSCTSSALTLDCEYDPNKGHITYSPERFMPGETLTLNSYPAGGYELDGWYLNDELLSNEELKMRFVYPTEGECNLEARFRQIVRNEIIGEEPVIDLVNQTVQYGMYPQHVVSDSFTLGALNALTETNQVGYYEYDEEYYCKVDSATPPTDSTGTSHFSNGTEIVKGNKYWFKVEPINWKIMRTHEDTYELMSSTVLDKTFYNVKFEGTTMCGDYRGNNGLAYYGDYQYSHLRKFLNVNFYNQAFFLGNDQLQSVTIDSAKLNPESEEYITTQILDDVYAYTRSELEALYGAGDWITGLGRRYSDYFMAIGAYSGYLTRTPPTDGRINFVISGSNPNNGSFNATTGCSTDLGIAPVINIKKPQ